MPTHHSLVGVSLVQTRKQHCGHDVACCGEQPDEHALCSDGSCDMSLKALINATHS